MTIPLPARMPATRCLFCPPVAIRPSQLLTTTPHFYLLAPRGQLVEGYLSIVTHECGDEPRLRSFADVPDTWQTELSWLCQVVRAFYVDAYQADTLFYEHGRGGGGASAFHDGSYSLHPHLCSLPGVWSAEQHLHAEFDGIPATLQTLRESVGDQPYVYIESSPGLGTAFCNTGPDGSSVESLRIKEVLGRRNGISECVDWRVEPGMDRLERLVARFHEWYSRNYDKHDANVRVIENAARVH